MDEIFKNYKELIIFSIPIIVGIYKIFTSGSFERQLFSKEKKFLYEVLIIYLIFIIVPTFCFYAIFSDPKIENIMNKLINILLIIYLFLILSIVFKWIFKWIFNILITFSKFLTKLNLFSKLNLNNKTIKKYIDLFNENKILLNNKINLRKYTFLLFYILTLPIFGKLNVILWKNESLSFLIFTSFLELTFVYFVLYEGLNLQKLEKPILVSIELENGVQYEEYYIYYPIDNKFILIGKPDDVNLCKEPLLINLDKIITCKYIKAN
ncbi:hypothetical protein [Lysinibacillus sp. NPDC086135]|uniref:hypothetical protein n=1 Tax=Lysinibacillus sp. NPDC086135 TaxID=3364130 RepID=UPI00381219B5